MSMLSISGMRLRRISSLSSRISELLSFNSGAGISIDSSADSVKIASAGASFIGSEIIGSSIGSFMGISGSEIGGSGSTIFGSAGGIGTRGALGAGMGGIGILAGRGAGGIIGPDLAGRGAGARAGAGFAGAGAGAATGSAKTGSELVLLVISSIAFCRSLSTAGFWFICLPTFNNNYTYVYCSTDFLNAQEIYDFIQKI